MCLLTTFGSRLSTCYSTRKRRVYCLRCSYSRASTGNFSPQGRGFPNLPCSVPQSSQTESLGFPSYPPPLNTPPLGTLQCKYQLHQVCHDIIIEHVHPRVNLLVHTYHTDLAVVQRLAPKLLIPKHNMCQ